MIYHGVGPQQWLEIPGSVLGAYRDRAPQMEAYQVLMMARAFVLAQSGPEAWEAAIDRTRPEPVESETFFRYMGKPVRLPELVASLSDRWGGGFGYEDELEA